ncbi:hypothetical protein ACP4OV_023136 [Aristida adscensionis]
MEGEGEPSSWVWNHNTQDTQRQCSGFVSDAETSPTELKRTSQELEKCRSELCVCLDSNKKLTREIADLQKELSDMKISKRVECSNVSKIVPSTLQQYDSHTLAKMQDCSDEGFLRNIEDIFDLRLQLDVFKTVFMEERRAHAEFEERITGELKTAQLHILLTCNQKEAIEEELKHEKSITEALEAQLHFSKDEVLNSVVTKIRMEAEDETARAIICLEQNVSLFQQQLKVSEKNEELTKQRLYACQLETDKLNNRLLEATKKNECFSSILEEKEAQVAKSNVKVAALEKKNCELQLQLERLERISCTMEEELDQKSKVTEGLKRELIELRSLLDERNICSDKLQNDLCKLLEEKRCCDTQLLIFKEKLDRAQALTKESEALGREAWQALTTYLSVAEDWKAYAKRKDEMVKILERSIEDHEIDIRALEDKVRIAKEQEVQHRTQQEELRVEFQNVRQQMLDVPSYGNAKTTMKDAMVDLNRHPGDVNNELLDAQGSSKIPQNEVSENESKTIQVLGPMQKGPTTSTIKHDHNMEMASNFEDRMEGSYASDAELGAHAFSSGSISKSKKQVPSPAAKPDVEVVEENELPPLAPLEPSRVPLNYKERASSDEMKRLRNKNHYEGQRTATDRRFWSIEQQDLYTSIYSNARVFNMKWIDWGHIDNIDQFAGIRERCVHLGLEQIMSHNCDWDNELIRQFYSTVHISADKTSMTWMTDGRRITTNKRAWEETFGIPGSAHTKIHSQLYLDDDNKRVLYTAANYTLGNTNGLSPLASIADKILKMTIYPRFGNQTHYWNVLYHIVEMHTFDVISLIFGEIDLLIRDRGRTKDLLYAPYIMEMIKRAFEYNEPRESKHQPYKPRNYKRKKQTKKVGPQEATVVDPLAVAPLDPPPSAFQPEELAVGHEAHAKVVDHHCQFESAGHQPQVQAIQRHTTVEPITRTDLIQVVEDGLRPLRDKLASMEERIGTSDDMIGRIETTTSAALSVQAQTVIHHEEH